MKFSSALFASMAVIAVAVAAAIVLTFAPPAHATALRAANPEWVQSMPCAVQRRVEICRSAQ